MGCLGLSTDVRGPSQRGNRGCELVAVFAPKGMKSLKGAQFTHSHLAVQKLSAFTFVLYSARSSPCIGGRTGAEYLDTFMPESQR